METIENYYLSSTRLIKLHEQSVKTWEKRPTGLPSDFVMELGKLTAEIECMVEALLRK